MFQGTNNRSPDDFCDDPVRFDAEFERQLSLCLSRKPNRAAEWIFAKGELQLRVAEVLISGEHDPALAPRHPLTKAEQTRKRKQIEIAGRYLAMLAEFQQRTGAHPDVARLFGMIVPMAFVTGMACHEISQRHQELLGSHAYLEAWKAARAKTARRSASMRASWKEKLTPTLQLFLKKYRGTDTYTAMARRFLTENPAIDRKERAIRELIRSVLVKESDTTLDSRSSTNGC
ncbi:MAG: hypothetical protein A2623_11835 [Caulobacterales bacterium RIFCSPHIGHO2_01_FULL_70_19]|nr:MAG: hypothetical protein A2623_11835 [Caulobacterales bacterium RIFCSPHIGHO2_01_FULL_70_19]